MTLDNIVDTNSLCGKSGDNFFFFLMATFIKEKQAVQENYTDKLKQHLKPNNPEQQEHQKKSNRKGKVLKGHRNILAI